MTQNYDVEGEERETFRDFMQKVIRNRWFGATLRPGGRPTIPSVSALPSAVGCAGQIVRLLDAADTQTYVCELVAGVETWVAIT